MSEKEMLKVLKEFINKKEETMTFYEAKAVIKLLLKIYKMTRNMERNDVNV